MVIFMIKGVGKQVVVLTTPGSKIYEQAIFILKQPAGETPCDKAMVAEAERIINTHIFSSAVFSPASLRRKHLRMLLISAGVSVLIGLSVLLLLLH